MADWCSVMSEGAAERPGHDATHLTVFEHHSRAEGRDTTPQAEARPAGTGTEEHGYPPRHTEYVFLTHTTWGQCSL